MNFLISGFLLLISLCEAFNERLIHSILRGYSSIPTDCMWKQRPEVSEANPLLFVHQRKAGGSSLRTTLHAAGDDMGLSRFIAGWDHVGLTTYEVPISSKIAIYGGHFSYPHNMKNLLGVDSEGNINLPPGQTYPVSCLTNFREPLARIQSCVYERYAAVFDEYHVSCLGDLPIKDLARIMIEFRFGGRFSCLNEPFRMFYSDNETVVNSLGFAYNHESHELTTRLSEFEVEAFVTAMQGIGQCVPVVLEVPLSFHLLNFTFPTLYHHKAFEDEIVVNAGHNGKNCARPSEAHMEVLRNLSYLENLMYNAVREKVTIAVKTLLPDSSPIHNDI